MNSDLCDRLMIPIYPTILIFHGSLEDSNVYNGMRKADAIVSFMRRHEQPVVSIMSSLEEVAELRQKDKVVVVGYFDNEDEVSHSVFASVANSNRDQYLFGSISSEIFGSSENVTKPAIIVYKTFDEGKAEAQYYESFNEETIENFIYEAASPLISELGVDLKPRTAVRVESKSPHLPR